MPSQKLRVHNVTLTDISISSWTNSSMLKALKMPSPLTNNRSLSTVLPGSISLQKTGSYVTDGRTALPPGTSCPTLKSKESHPFALQMGFALEPGLKWWVSSVLKKQDVIISLVKHWNIKYSKKTQKYSLPL
ncbi:hypothetical protein ACHAXS_000803 [Conticribra weissflogii]